MVALSGTSLPALLCFAVLGSIDSMGRRVFYGVYGCGVVLGGG